MEHQKILENVIETLSNYYKKQKSFIRIFLNEPVMSKAIEVFDNEMLEMVDHAFDLMGIPNEESPDKYDKKNWTRGVCTNLIKIAAKNDKYVEPAVELINNWENLTDFTSKVESHTWFHYDQLLDEHLTGYKKWHEEQRQMEKTKTKSK
ncbi:hypothetical protein COM86_09445 [Priestia megaterium]|jgi:hypothetical protein|nr:hypothetical protein [Priestia megaterium]MED3972925.1 hypothetical protein [Priestia megaterium]MED4794280.1 hypothetical protein [Priestia megaterium]PEB62690.1 hypothetical protein COM86_09445 [Priestia megaterium]PEE76045.1 hypothetical protein COM81_08590 [Priestia megaterium]PFI93929.1 hypothetical protein COI84_17760 [Priestia megaterium]